MRLAFLRFLAVGCAGFVGATLRWLVSVFFNQFGLTFPLGTFVINLTGSLFLGWFFYYSQRHQISDMTRLALGTGFVGAYTTFSTFMFETDALARKGAMLEAAANLGASVILGLIAVRIGVYLGQRT